MSKMDKMTNKGTFIRGGRLRKTSKGLISFAPFLAGASALALGALLATTSPVEAGSCGTPATTGDATSECSGAANPSGGSQDQTISLSAPASGSLTVTESSSDPFGLDVSGDGEGKGLVITSDATSTDISVDLDGDINADEDAIEIDMDGTGTTTVTMDGDLTSVTERGLNANIDARATGAVMVTVGGDVTAAEEGIHVEQNGTGAATVTSNGDITSTAGTGVLFRTGRSTTGDVEVNVNGNVTASGADGVSDGGGSFGAESNAVYVINNGSSETIFTSGENSVIRNSATLQFAALYVSNVPLADNNPANGGRNVKITLNGDVGTSSSASAGGVAVTNRNRGYLTAEVNGDIFASNGNGLDLNHSGVGFIDGTVGSSSTINGEGIGVRMHQNANNDAFVQADNVMRLTIEGTVEGDVGVSVTSLHVHHDSTITIAGSVTGRDGTALYLGGVADHDVTVRNGATLTGKIDATKNRDGNAKTTGAVGLNISGTVTVASGDAIELAGTGDHTVTVGTGGTVTGAIDASAATGALTFDIGGTVNGGSGNAIELGGAGDHTVTVGTGGTVTGAIDTSATTGALTFDISGAISVTSGNTLEFGGAGNSTVILRDGANIGGRIVKLDGAGNVAWRIEGDITDNPLIWKNGFSDQPDNNTFHDFGASDSILIAAGARAEFGRGEHGMDSNINDVPVTLSGRLVFNGIWEETQFNLQNFVADGGEIEMDIDFTGGDRMRDRNSPARFTTNSISFLSERGVRVNIRAVGGLPRFSVNEDGEIVIAPDENGNARDTDGDGRITIENVIRHHRFGPVNPRGAGAFVAGDWLDNGVDDGSWELMLVYVEGDAQTGHDRWHVVARPMRPGEGGGPSDPSGPSGPTVLIPTGPATLFDTLPMVLAHLGQPESMHRRTQNRSFQQGTGVWGRIQTGNISVETTAAPFETDTRDVTFGIRAPVIGGGASQSVTLDANLTLKTAETEARVMDGKQDIQTNAVVAGVGATWKRGGLYADGQFQYARFDNDMDTADDTRLASLTADSFTAGVEVGYAFDGGDINLGEWLGEGALTNIFVTPSAQVSWSQVGFSDFVATNGKTVSLDDGTVINGRVGAVVETNWENVVFYEAFAPAVVRLQGSADVIFPLDGLVVTQVDGANQPSEREDPVLDLGVGASYTWEKANNAYTLSADVSSLQGSEVDGYEANVGFKYQF